ncbi:Hypothetical predicted protein [Lynx pardinus]|uniref:Uncharacterized protein n=1 Tax=Lynx pardinus TaxID=191816 RepID=A0A485MP17_LYNPA|nr:Hypothetical predicted protein [Lynx pardinus]
MLPAPGMGLCLPQRGGELESEHSSLGTAAHLEPTRGSSTGRRLCLWGVQNKGKQRSRLEPSLLRCALCIITHWPRCQLTDLIQTLGWDLGTSFNAC